MSFENLTASSPLRWSCSRGQPRAYSEQGEPRQVLFYLRLQPHAAAAVDAVVHCWCSPSISWVRTSETSSARTSAQTWARTWQADLLCRIWAAVCRLQAQKMASLLLRILTRISAAVLVQTWAWNGAMEEVEGNGGWR